MEKSAGLEIIATIKGSYPEKFGVPRQAGIVTDSRATIILQPPFNHENYIRGLELYSHLWLIFKFHHNAWNGKPMVRPQRLGGNRRMGVFATRSSFRPNGLGLSAVKIESIDFQRVEIEISGHDLVDNTPIYCIKPYIPFADSIPDATSRFAEDRPESFQVSFTNQAEQQLAQWEDSFPNLQSLIEAVVSQDPTPKFHDDHQRIYGLKLYHFNIQFKKSEDGFKVLRIDSMEL